MGGVPEVTEAPHGLRPFGSSTSSHLLPTNLRCLHLLELRLDLVYGATVKTHGPLALSRVVCEVVEERQDTTAMSKSFSFLS